MKFALICMSKECYGIGNTREDAIADANYDCEIVDYENATDGEFVVLPCTDRYAQSVQNGFVDQSYTIHNGVIDVLEL